MSPRAGVKERAAAAGETAAGQPADGAPRTTERMSPLSGMRRALANPAASYILVTASVLALTAFGLIMVLSASSITAYQGGAWSSYTIFARQAAFAGAGILLMFGLSRVPAGWWRPLAWIGFGLALGLQALTLSPLGVEVNGNQNWVGMGPVRLQPSEFVKVGLAVWLGAVLSRPGARDRPWSTWAIAAGGFLLSAGLIMAGGDLGTAIIVLALFMGALFVSDLPVLASLGTLVLGAGAALLFVVTSPNRMQRIEAMASGHENADAAGILGAHWQSAHGTYALASGGWFGVGLGASREKWAWLPEAHNDFIFAIIGEELGLLGSLIVIALLAVLGWGLVRAALRTDSALVRITTTAAFMWLIGQAAINIAVVTTLLPVIGVPLPFVSYGGSALIANLLVVGIVLSFARAEPGVAAALSLRRSASRTSRGPRSSSEGD